MPSPPITGYAAWYQAADLLNGGALPSNGAAVSSWKDKSGNARDLSQATPALQPTFAVSGIGGQPAVSFTGTLAVEQNLVSGTLNFAQPGTVYIVCKFGSPLSNAQYLMDGATNRWLINNENPGTTTKIGTYAGSASADFTVPSNALLSPSIIVLQFNGASSLCRLNGIDRGAASANPGTSALDVLSVGGRNGLGGDGFGGPIAEIIIYLAAHSAAQMQQNEAYLGSFYSIQGPWNLAPQPRPVLQAVNRAATF